MKQESEKNYYQILGITPEEATDQKIEEAYKRAKAAYNTGSVAAYSLFSSKEKENMLKEIIEAYEMIKDPEKRKAYNTRFPKADQEDYIDPLDISDEDSLSISEDQINNQEPLEVPQRTAKYSSCIKLKQPLVAMNDANRIISEQYRVLYTRIEQISVWRSYKTFAVTSAVQGEGKSVTSLNLAYVIAQEFNKKVLLLECDLKKPSLSSYFMGKDQGHGLIDVIRGEAELEEAIAPLENSNLHLLLARANTMNSSEMLGSSRMKEILNRLKTEFDYVIMDSPPILPLADMNILSRMADGLILVVRAGKAPKDIVLKSISSLPVGDVIGIVLNGADISFKNYYHTYYSQ